MALPIARPAAGLRPGDWNTIELVLDANILRAFLNDAGGIGDTVAERSTDGTGLLRSTLAALAKCDSKTLSYKDLQPRVAQPEKVSTRFRMQTLNEFYYSWGPAVADFNHDGTMDIVAGPYYYLGPDYGVAREIYLAATIDPGQSIFQRPAVRLRLHGRRMAGRAERHFPTAGCSVREPERRIAPMGCLHGHRSDDLRIHAAEGH